MSGDRDQAPASRTTGPPNQQEVELSKAATGGAKDPTAVESRGGNLAAPDLDLAGKRGSGKPAAWPRAPRRPCGRRRRDHDIDARDRSPWRHSRPPAQIQRAGQIRSRGKRARAPPSGAGEQVSRHLDATLLPTRAPRPTASSTAELATKTTAATRPPRVCHRISLSHLWRQGAAATAARPAAAAEERRRRRGGHRRLGEVPPRVARAERRGGQSASADLFKTMHKVSHVSNQRE